MLISGNDNYKIYIDLWTSVSAYVSLSILSHEKGLEKGVIKLPICRMDVETFALS